MLTHHILVGTHHKSGTAWMNAVFRRFAQRDGIGFVPLTDLSELEMEQRVLSAVRDADPARCVFFSTHSEFPDFRGAALKELPVRGIHMVRDPRALLLSAARYHCHAKEPQLLVPDQRFGGRTYQETISSLPNDDARVRFEIENSGGRNIRAMGSFDEQGVFTTVRYEDLIDDTSLTLWHQLCVGLGMSGSSLVHGMIAFYERSIMSAKDPLPQTYVRLRAEDAKVAVGRKARRMLEAVGVRERHVHIQSRTGGGWRTLSSDLLDSIHSTFAAELEALGYDES